MEGDWGIFKARDSFFFPFFFFFFFKFPTHEVFGECFYSPRNSLHDFFFLSGNSLEGQRSIFILVLLLSVMLFFFNGGGGYFAPPSNSVFTPYALGHLPV